MIPENRLRPARGATDAERIAMALGGRKVGGSWTARCPSHFDRTPSLSICDCGDRVLVKCHANCRQSEVILALRKLGLWPVDANHERKPPVGVKRSTPGIFIDGSTDRVSARAIELWRDASHIVDTPVADYLGSRGLRQAMLLDLHHVLRFTAACPFQLESGATVRLPAMLALFRHVRSNEPRAIHRTALRPDGLGKSQHPGLGATKRMLGPVAGCAIKLTPDADVLHGLGVVEGIETGLSVLCAGWSPIWVLGSAGAVADFVPLPGLESLVIFADADEAGIKAAKVCRSRWQAAGHECTILLPPQDGDDWNDVARAT